MERKRLTRGEYVKRGVFVIGFFIAYVIASEISMDWYPHVPIEVYKLGTLAIAIIGGCWAVGWMD